MLRTTQGGAAGRQVDWVNGKGVGEGVWFLYKGNSMVGWLHVPKPVQVRLVRFLC